MPKKNIFHKITTALATSATISLAIAVELPKARAFSLIQEDLFFGRNIAGDGEVSESEFQTFIDDVITPRFPAGLTILNSNGQFLDSTGRLIEERTKVVTLFREDTFANEVSISEIVKTYRKQFNQESVLQVVNKDELTVSFSSDEDLFNNSSVPKFIQTELFFGRNIPGGGEVSQSKFQTFVDSVITPRFPAGLTIFDGNGQFLNSTGTIIEEPSKVVTLLLEDGLSNETAVNEIVAAYRQQFNQESVLVAANQDVKVSFGLGDDLIDNSPIPELIQADLFFGRNIPGGGEVSESEFQAFVDSVITPLFPAGLTIFDANGQFQNSTGTIIEEPSKVISFIFEDTLDNETSINQIIGAYLQKFNQESVLTVVDEDIRVRFVESEPVPEPSSVAGVLLFSTSIIALRLKKKVQKQH
ncbi:DUF3574 domain-containing protein [Komarekiella sp. 'clone 1']|uniref:DUF3574 domain-containing protein n=1 Tax=Komarekiella delphini-convector SJRDD-AB1 TaxID=2593771 RepID=A0AA40VT32_9NOST|nr:DUF3574 domain-containing protein [Komarekiella delphini-convector]MBD6618647.1 DUF3574 domain-containing protein [Komarekiella delphini-convector SJRDD-AB1]